MKTMIAFQKRTVHVLPLNIMLFALFSGCLAISSPAYAGWNCKCGRYVTTQFCTSCGAKEPLPSPVPAYTPPERPSYDTPEFYDGKLVKKTPIHIGFLGPELALPPGEYYSVYGMCTDPFVATVVNAYGFQSGALMASTYDKMYGLQIGGLVASAKEFGGVQIGCFNYVDHGGGLQIGVVNRAKSFTGFQIGAINIITQSPVPFFPIINACF